jgi:16S rRNA (cytidine1402-2'-O)-methyltransferase
MGGTSEPSPPASEEALPPFPPGLYLVASPIGNLEDITLRALRCLREADLIACEDTRHSRRLLTRHQIAKPLLSLHEHNEAKATVDLLARIQNQQQRIAYLTDAGCPGISDPGERLIHRAIEAGIHYDVLPGPSAFVTAAIGAGISSTPLYFGGFLPVKKGQRQLQLQLALQREVTSVFYESPHRLCATLEQLRELEPTRLAAVAREITKKFQEYRRAPVAELAEYFAGRSVKGEICLLISPSRLPSWLKHLCEA